MAGKVIAISQQKGGVGKTTLAIQLAIAWRASGKRVAMLDIDPQASLAAWYGRRIRLHGEDDGLTVKSLSGWRLGNELSAAKWSADYIVIDTPPHAETDAKTAIRLADLAILPIQPTMLDLWATKPTLDLAEAEKTQALLVLNRVPARGLSADAVKAEIKSNKWPLAKTQLGNRQVFAASIGDGRGIAETAPRTTAGQEIGALAREILRRLR